jgi:uncharacterized membrane protein YjgN (DUF898 family)
METHTQFTTSLLRDAPTADPAPVSEQTPAQAPIPIPLAQPFQFKGDGESYFGIWILNLVLTILTLGFYSPWAKVRREQFFHANTWLSQTNFNYLGQPWAIFRGRIVAAVLFAVYYLAKELSFSIAFGVLGALAIIFPWLLKRSLVFRARNTLPRGLRFRFTGNNAGAYVTFLFWGGLAVITGFLAAPIAMQRIRAYTLNNAHFGDLPFRFTATASQYYRIFFRTGLYWLAALLVGSLLVLVIGPFGYVLAGLIAFWLTRAHYVAHLQNLNWNNTTIGPHRFVSTAHVTPLFFIMLKNTLLTLVTLGLYRPFAVVNILKYRLSALSFVPGDSLDTVRAVSTKDSAAIGEEAADMFDLDIAL